MVTYKSPPCPICGVWECLDCGVRTSRRSRYFPGQHHCRTCKSFNGRMITTHHRDDVYELHAADVDPLDICHYPLDGSEPINRQIRGQQDCPTGRNAMNDSLKPVPIDTFDELEDHLHGLNYEHGQGTAVVITQDGRLHLAFCTDPDGTWFLENGDPAERITRDENDFATYEPLGLEHIKAAGPYLVVHEPANSVSANEPVFEVHELGEEGDLWLVTATTADTHPDRINLEVAKWVIETCGVKDGTASEVIERLAQSPAHTFREDWAYVPINPENPDDECRLMYGADAPASLPRFAGTLVNA